MFSSSVAVADESGSNVLCYAVMATVIACLLVVEFMALGGVLDGLDHGDRRDPAAQTNESPIAAPSWLLAGAPSHGIIRPSVRWSSVW